MADRDDEVAREIARQAEHNDFETNSWAIATALRQAREEGRKEQPITAETVRRVLEARWWLLNNHRPGAAEPKADQWDKWVEAIAQRANQQEEK